MPSPQNRQKPQSGAQSLFSLVILTAILVLVGWAVINRQGIWDWWKLRNYDPPAEISALADQTTMNDSARRIFYVNQPSLLHKTNFSKFCPESRNEKTIVLGCYHPPQNGIYVLAVDDARLEGVEQVTSAHEMLHAAYDRLSSSEREEINGMLNDYYQNKLADERIRKVIESYKSSEPNDVVNEMHSIFGTEIKDLPSALESYYAQYFSNRGVVADFAAKYQGEFTSRQTLIDQYDQKLDALRTQIDSLESQLKSQRAEIDNEQQRLSQLRANNSIAAYNAGVPGYNRMVQEYNAGVNQLKAIVSQHNNLVNTRNAIAFEVDQLSRELRADQSTINN